MGNRVQGAAIFFAVGMLALGSGEAAAAPSVTIDWGDEIDTLDPALSYSGDAWGIIDQMFVGLTRQDGNQIVGDAATRWSVSSDGRTWTFHLAPGLRWSDGSRLTAADFEYGIKRSLDPRTNFDPADLFSSSFDMQGVIVGATEFANQPAVTPLAISPDTVGVHALDTTTLQIETVNPTGFMPALMTLVSARAVPRHTIEAHGLDWLLPGNIVTSGAYTLTAESADGTTLVLTKNPSYAHAATTQIAKATLVMLPYDAVVGAYVSGTIDAIKSQEYFLQSAGAGDPALAPDHTIRPGAGTVALAFNSVSGLTSPDVRRALSAATDRAAISQAVFGTPSLAARTWVPPTVPLAPPPAVDIAYDPAAARLFRAHAGSAFPASVTVEVRPVARYAATGPVLKASWESVFGPGFHVNVVYGHDIVTPPGVDANMFGWGQDYGDPQQFLSYLWGSGSPFNPGPFADPAFDLLARAADESLAPIVRAALFAATESTLTTWDAAEIPMFYIPDEYVAKPWVHVVGSRLENWTVGR